MRAAVAPEVGTGCFVAFVVTVAALPEILILIGVEVLMEAKVFTPVA